MQLCTQNHTLSVRKGTVSVTEITLLRGNAADAALGEGCDLLNHLLHLTAVGSGVHKHSAAQTPGDAVGKLQARESGILGKQSQPGQGNTCIRLNSSLVYELQGVHLSGRAHHQTLQALVRSQKIGPVSHNKGAGAALVGQAK